MNLNFEGQTALVTGGTRGIGYHIAKDFYDLGANVILTGTKKESFELIQSQFTGNPGFVKYFSVDFSDSKSTNNFISAIDTFDRIDILINNSGINKIDFIYETNMDDWQRITDVNLKAPFMLMRQVSKKMKDQHYGRIVNIGSIFGVISKSKRSIYSATKHGLHGLTIAASLDLAPHGVLVNTLSPGFVLTELTKSILSDEEIADLSKQVPLQRFAKPEEISVVVLFIASNKNTFMTGQNIIVDGGFVNV